MSIWTPKAQALADKHGKTGAHYQERFEHHVEQTCAFNPFQVPADIQNAAAIWLVFNLKGNLTNDERARLVKVVDDYLKPFKVGGVQ